MAKARAIVKRRKAVRNIRKITKTMQMIADGEVPEVASSPPSGPSRIPRKCVKLVRELASSVGNVEHPLLRRPSDKEKTGPHCCAGHHQQPRIGRGVQRQRPARRDTIFIPGSRNRPANPSIFTSPARRASPPSTIRNGRSSSAWMCRTIPALPRSSPGRPVHRRIRGRQG